MSAHRLSFGPPTLKLLQVFTYLSTLALISALCVSAFGQSVNQTPTPSSNQTNGASSGTEAAQPIPLAQIADRASQLDESLSQVDSQLMTTEDLAALQEKAQTQEQTILERLGQTRELLASIATPLELEDEQRYWRSKSRQYSAQRKNLTERAAKLDEQLQLLNTQQSSWQATWDQVRDARGIEAIAERVRQQLQRIHATRSRSQEQLNAILTLQNRASEEEQQVTEILFRLRQTRERDLAGVFQADSNPLWKVRQHTNTPQTTSVFHRFFGRSLNGAAEFMRTRVLATTGLILAYLFALFCVYALRRYVSRLPGSSAAVELAKLLTAPYSMALLLGLCVTGQYVAAAPISIAFIFYLLYVLPVLRLLTKSLTPILQACLYTAASFYVLEGVYLLIQAPLFLSRTVFALISGLALLAILRIFRLLSAHNPSSSSRKMIALEACLYLDLALLIAALIADVVGFFSLSQLLGMIALIAPFIAASLYCSAYVLILIATVALDSPRAASLLEAPVASAKWWCKRIIAGTAVFLWFRSLLHLLTLYDGAVAMVFRLLRQPIGFEKASFTIGGILSIVLIMMGGYALARIAILLLKTIVLPRIPLQRGLPYAVTRITYYALLIMIAAFALAASGLELNKFTLLTGAMGVGLGFGLQNIVSNFISGIILLCERPIHIGDIVEFSGLVGTVRRVGARSSTILTFQGAEVIVPNSNLLSNQVINWTLSSQLRRIDIKIGVAHGTDPETVIKLLVGVAEAHPGVLLERPPAAFFMGFGDSTLNFELQFWCTRQDTWFRLQSDVTVAVAKSLREAGIEIPLPQRELHLRNSGTSAEEPTAKASPQGADLPAVRRRSAGM